LLNALPPSELDDLAADADAAMEKILPKPGEDEQRRRRDRRHRRSQDRAAGVSIARGLFVETAILADTKEDRDDHPPASGWSSGPAGFASFTCGAAPLDRPVNR
jgi:hypothetical protein